jgi:THO complex subunit 1
MVVMRHLLSLTASEKQKRDARTQTPNKVVFYPFTLSPEDAAWAQQKDKDAYNLTDLAFQPHPQYRTFSKAVRAVLDRDEAWVRWKENGCPSFEEPSWTEKEFDVVEKRLREITAPLPPFRYPLGNAPLSELWKNAGDLSMEGLKGRVKLPVPEDFLMEELEKTSLEDLTPAEQVEKIDEKASREWRGLRLAMKYDMVGVSEQKSLTKYIESKKEVVKDEEMLDVETPSKEVKPETGSEKKEEAMDVQS